MILMSSQYLDQYILNQGLNLFAILIVPLFPALQLNWGKLPRGYCSVLLSPCTRLHSNLSLNASQAVPRSTCAPYFTVPDVLGTFAQTDVMWLCGYNMYVKLPPNWAGIWALVIPADHSFIISAMHRSKRRQRRSFAPHDAIWETDVPSGYKLWSTSQKVALAPFPQLGFGKLMLRMETLSYRFSGFVNTTLAILEAERVELKRFTCSGTSKLYSLRSYYSFIRWGMCLGEVSLLCIHP